MSRGYRGRFDHGNPDRRLHILFLNTQNSLRADVSVHVSLARALDRSQARVSVATNTLELEGDSARAAFESIQDTTLLRLDLGRPMSTERGLTRAIALLNNVWSFTTLLRLAMWCRRECVDVIHVSERPRDAAFGLILARLAGCGVVIQGHTTYYPHAPSPAASVADWILRHADAIVGVSHFTADSFSRQAHVPGSRVFAVHNAADESALWAELPGDARSRMRQVLGIPDDVPVVGAIGRLMRYKDQATLLEALAIVRSTFPETRLVLAGLPADSAPDGRGDYKDYLVRRVDELGLGGAVVFTGFLPHAEMPRLYAAFDVFAHACVEEPFGLVVVEAMARLRPVIAADGGGVREIVRDGVDGLLVPPRQPGPMAAAIIGLLGNPVRADRLAHAGRARVLDAFTPEVQARAMLGVYQHVVAGERNR